MLLLFIVMVIMIDIRETATTLIALYRNSLLACTHAHMRCMGTVAALREWRRGVTVTPLPKQGLGCV